MNSVITLTGTADEVRNLLRPAVTSGRLVHQRGPYRLSDELWRVELWLRPEEPAPAADVTAATAPTATSGTAAGPGPVADPGPAGGPGAGSAPPPGTGPVPGSGPSAGSGPGDESPAPARPRSPGRRLRRTAGGAAALTALPAAGWWLAGVTGSLVAVAVIIAVGWLVATGVDLHRDSTGIAANR